MIRNNLLSLKREIQLWMCRIGLHWLSNHKYNFRDSVSGNWVYNAKCPYGKKWMVDIQFPLPIFKVPYKKSNNAVGLRNKRI